MASTEENTNHSTETHLIQQHTNQFKTKIGHGQNVSSGPEVDPSTWMMYYSQYYMYPWSQYYNYQFYSQYITQSQTAVSHPLPPGVTTSCKSLYLGNLSEKVSEALLYDIFSTVGPVETCKLIKDKGTGESAGYGFIDYYDHRTAALALQSFNGRSLYGLEIKVNWAFANQKEDLSTHFHIFVGDLSLEVDDRGLLQAFNQYGSVSDARIMVDPATGRSRGYGFVAFRKREDAQKALTEMNGTRIGNKQVRLSWANQKIPGMPDFEMPTLDKFKPLISGMDYSVVVAQAPITNTTVYVGGVTPDVTEQMVRVAMTEYGNIEEIRIQPGFVFVKYRTHEQAAKAIVGMTGKLIAGRVVKCSWGKEKMLLPPPLPGMPPMGMPPMGMPPMGMPPMGMPPMGMPPMGMPPRPQ